MKDILKNTGIVLFFCFVFTLFIVSFTPYPASYLVHQLFSNGGPAKPPSDYKTVKSTITIEKDLTYDSLLPNNRYDLIRPKEVKGKLPVILWVHGGAFVGGQKEDVSIYANTLAAEGYAVVNMEYALAPGSKYPGPLIQMSDLYQELKTQADHYKLDMSSLFLAGDSAGGQVVTQFELAQLDKAYSKLIGLPQDIKPETIKGSLLFCTPFSLKEMGQSTGSTVADYFIKNIGWAYTGEANWSESSLVKEADLQEQVNTTLPPVFITDATANSFTEQGQAFGKKMKKLGAEVTEVYHDNKENLQHEYQFDLTLPASKKTLNAVKDFLNQNKD